MKRRNLPQSDSIEELAHVWDEHDLTDFEAELEEVVEPMFERDTAVTIHLQPDEAEAVKKLAASQGVPDSDLINQCVSERLETA